MMGEPTDRGLEVFMIGVAMDRTLDELNTAFNGVRDQTIKTDREFLDAIKHPAQSLVNLIARLEAMIEERESATHGEGSDH